MKRTFLVFLCATVALLTLSVGKALLVSGISTLPAAHVLAFASICFGVVAAMLDWAVLQGHRKNSAKPASPPHGIGQVPMQERLGLSGEPVASSPDVQRARQHPIVFREFYPPPQEPTLSFYGGTPVGPPDLIWPRVRNKPGQTPLSFVMQWGCTELSQQDQSGLLPRDGVLYLFGDLSWGQPLDFAFLHAPGPVSGWQPLPLPAGLPPVFGDQGAYSVSYCSPLLPKQDQDVPSLLPQWFFTPVALPYPHMPRASGPEPQFWRESTEVAEALLNVQHPDGGPDPQPLSARPLEFQRPFTEFPHDYAAVRIVMAKILNELRRPDSRLLRDVGDAERQARIEVWREEATQLYRKAAHQSPAARVPQQESDEIWQWMAGLQPVLSWGWRELVEKCVNATLGFGVGTGSFIPPEWKEAYAKHHALATAYLRDERPENNTPEARAAWEARRAAGTMKQVRAVHAPSPNHLLGLPSYVQGDVEEYLAEWMLLLELSNRDVVGLHLGEGVLQFLIRPDDLRKGRFDNMVFVASAY